MSDKPLIAARTFCAPDTGTVKAGKPVPRVSAGRTEELRGAGLIEKDKPARAAEPKVDNGAKDA